MFHLGQRPVPDFLVRADVIAIAERAGADLSERAGFQRSHSGMNVVVLHGEVDGRVDDLDHILEQVAAHSLGKTLQSQPLLSVRFLIHDQHRFHGISIAVHVAQGAAGFHHAHYPESIQVDALERAFVHAPAEHGKISHEVHFRIGETRSGVDIGRARFHVLAMQLRFFKTRAEGHRSHRR